MVSGISNEDNDDATCPCCRLRAAVVQALLDPDSYVLDDSFDGLLDALESGRALGRAVDFADGKDSPTVRDAADRFAVNLVQLVHMILSAGDEHLTVNHGKD